MTEFSDSIEQHQLAQFAAHGYAIVRRVLTRPHLDVYAAYARFKQFRPHYREAQALHWYADALGESLLVALQPLLERVTARRLLPTYSYLRIYQTGAVLPRHSDRDACEFSASLTLGYQAPALWPLWIESGGVQQAVALDSGDLVVYRGCDLPHWREALQGHHWIQLFLHYVDAAGARARQKYDGRLLIGMPELKFEAPIPPAPAA